MKQRRDFKGYYQTREEGDKWRFHVTGFDGTYSGADGFCSVLRADMTEEDFVPIDAKDRIKIEGKWYGMEHWTH